MTDSAHIAAVTATDFEQIVIQGSFERPVLVDFWADWCAPCRQLMPILSRLAEEFKGQFFLAKVDTEAEQALAAQFGIRSLPTVQLFKNGQAVDQFMGALPEGQIREFLSRHISRASDQLLDQARQAMADGDLNAASALIERAKQDDPDNSRVFIAQVQLKAVEGDAAGALELLEHTPLDLAADPELAAIRGRLAFSAAVADAPAAEALQTTLKANPGDNDARYQLAAHQVLAGDNEAALENLLTLLKRDRQYGDDAARKGMVAIFDLLGGSGELVSRYRAKMLSSLY
ncbi:thioredoxin [Lamprobacter modestohalophilus]|uniref:Thioredoxin n=1 Tax=Lamprobacter modestohalophilus TaxID=1064514 RepID=A0A9X0WC35_9GAMM|nr:thioredoxin [Lamprobacter modestohalophilus]MBK1620662.1 thioredoxin [Lamprobacter modestohalophilus]